MLDSVTELAEKCGLSTYMLQVVVDFCVRRKSKPLLLCLVCNNPEIVPLSGGSEGVRETLQARATWLKRQCGEMTKEARDEAMIHRFLGWAQTQEGHFLFVSYRGGDRHSLDSWRVVKRDHLRFFHTRFISGKRSDYLPLYRLHSSDVVETGDGNSNLSLDVRFISSLWCEEHPEARQLIEDHRHLFRREEDYLMRSHRLTLRETEESSNSEE
jgi:hypothetical protein